MISLVVIADDGSHHTEWFQKPEVMIGRVHGNDVVLASSSVSKRHARLVFRDGKHILVDLKSTNGTFVNGRRLTSPLVVRETDQIYIGSFRIEIVPFGEPTDDEDTAEVNVVELRLLANIASHEPGAREVYADWLEEHADPIRAELLRLQDKVRSHPSRDQPGHLIRLVQLARQVDPQWRQKLSRDVIDGCPREGEDCPGDWGMLTGSRDPGVRSCPRCMRTVHYCFDTDRARQLVVRTASVPVVVDLLHAEHWAEIRRAIAPSPPRPRSSTNPGIGPRPPGPPARAFPAQEPMTWQPGRCGPDVED
ncbi:MAG TPA: FHA domain-containing protein [Kofleriaceae bacterium]